MEKCGNVAKDIPYITMENQCDEIVYDECQEVRRKFDRMKNRNVRLKQTFLWTCAKERDLGMRAFSCLEERSRGRKEKRGEENCFRESLKDLVR